EVTDIGDGIPDPVSIPYPDGGECLVQVHAAGRVDGEKVDLPPVGAVGTHHRRAKGGLCRLTQNAVRKLPGYTHAPANSLESLCQLGCGRGDAEFDGFHGGYRSAKGSANESAPGA